MNAILGHLTRCAIAGVVALLPVGGLVLSILYMENMLAESWLVDQWYYFPGLGILAAAAIIYVIGLIVTTFVGRWIWGRADALLKRLPILGRLYQTLKQIVGYGEGEDAVFRRVVLVPSPVAPDAFEMGLVTNQVDDKLVVFVPGAPNPTVGRLITVDPSTVKETDIKVSDALKSLVSVGATNTRDAVPEQKL